MLRTILKFALIIERNVCLAAATQVQTPEACRHAWIGSYFSSFLEEGANSFLPHSAPFFFYSVVLSVLFILQWDEIVPK